MFFRIHMRMLHSSFISHSNNFSTLFPFNKRREYDDDDDDDAKIESQIIIMDFFFSSKFLFEIFLARNPFELNILHIYIQHSQSPLLFHISFDYKIHIDTASNATEYIYEKAEGNQIMSQHHCHLQALRKKKLMKKMWKKLSRASFIFNCGTNYAWRTTGNKTLFKNSQELSFYPYAWQFFSPLYANSSSLHVYGCTILIFSLIFQLKKRV